MPFLRPHPQSGNRAAGQLQKVHLFLCRGNPLIQLRQVNDVLHQRYQPRRLCADDADKLRNILLLDKAVL